MKMKYFFLITLFLSMIFSCKKKDIKKKVNEEVLKNQIVNKTSIVKSEPKIKDIDFSNGEIYFSPFIKKAKISYLDYKDAYVYKNYIVVSKNNGSWIKGYDVYLNEYGDILDNIIKNKPIYVSNIDNYTTTWERAQYRGLYKDCILISYSAFDEYEVLEVFNLINNKMLFNNEHNTKMLKMINENNLSIYQVVNKKEISKNGSNFVEFNLKEIIIDFSNKSISIKENFVKDEKEVPELQ